MADDRNAMEQPARGDVILLKQSIYPGVVHRVSTEASSVYVQHDGSIRDIGVQYYAGQIAEVIRAMPPEGAGTGEPLPDVAPVTLEPSTATITAAGGSGSFTVTMTGPGTDNTWNADPQAEATWFHITSPPIHTAQSASGTVSWTADPNQGEARTADVYISGKTFKLTQEGAV